MTDLQLPAPGAGVLSSALAHLPLARLTRLYRPPAADATVAGGGWRQDPARAQRTAAVVAAYHGGGPLLFGWARPSAAGPVTVLTPAHPAGGAVRLPPGGHGTTLRPAILEGLLAGFMWTPIGGTADGLLLEQQPEPHPDGMRPSLDDCLLEAWQEPFAWLLLAEPVPGPVITDLAAEVAFGEREARTRTSSPEYVVQADRLALRHRELRAAAATGLWQIRLLAAGRTRADAKAVAGLVIASADLTHLPYALTPIAAPTTSDLHTALTATYGGGDEAAFPYAGSSALVAALARPPEAEVPGIRLVRRPDFDVTPETATTSGICVGTVVDRTGRPAGDLTINQDSLNRHTFVTGATGSGKSHTIRHLLTQASKAGVPWLVIEPAKAEYAYLASHFPDGDLVVVRPGDPDAVPVGINPLQPAPGFPLQTHLDLTKALFAAAFDADEPFPQVLAAALTRSYTQLGWDLTLGQPRDPAITPRYPALADLEQAATTVVEEIGYGQEVTDNVRGFITVRLASLRLGTTGGFLTGSQPIDFTTLLTRNVVLEIEDVGDDRDKAFMIGAVLIRLVEHLRARDRHTRHAGGLRHLTVVEEAHRLLRRTDQPGPAAHAVELFAALLAEIRAYGEGLIIAEQIPAKLLPDAIKNTAVKIVHRLPAQDDRDSVGATMNLSQEQSDYLVTLTPGTAAVFTDGMDHPILTHMPLVPDGESGKRGSAAALLADTGSGGHCVPAGCTLRDQATASRLLTTFPLITVWAELTVVGHVIGLPAPEPRNDLATALHQIPDRLRDCALHQAVTAAVGARSVALADTHSPAAFADHVATELIRLADGVAMRCASPVRAWLAAPFRWNPLRLALTAYLDHHPTAGPHPNTADWEAEYGRHIPGHTGQAQLNTVTRWSRQLLRDRTTSEAVLFGTPSHLETALGARRDDNDWPAVLTHALTAFTTVENWPHPVLTDTIVGNPR